MFYYIEHSKCYCMCIRYNSFPRFDSSVSTRYSWHISLFLFRGQQTVLLNELCASLCTVGILWLRCTVVVWWWLNCWYSIFGSPDIQLSYAQELTKTWEQIVTRGLDIYIFFSLWPLQGTIIWCYNSYKTIPTACISIVMLATFSYFTWFICIDTRYTFYLYVLISISCTDRLNPNVQTFCTRRLRDFTRYGCDNVNESNNNY